MKVVAAMGGPAARDWDAVTYDRISAPQQRWAAEQMERLELVGDESVLDAGCGSGRITLELCERVPRGTVFAVDSAPAMIAHAQRVLGERATAMRQDLAELELPAPVHLIFSNATFHWIPDHDALFAALHRNLRPGGRLIAQCGGRGNIESVRTAAERVMAEEPFAPHFAAWARPWTYAGAEETADRLWRAGFTEIETSLQERPTPVEDGRQFIETVCLVRHLDPLPPALRRPFVDDVLSLLTQPLVLDYVRLNVSARRP
ncbi:MAG TPA: methyltransferase domain-containing protein [Solirubrobacteraceae bacterium]|nr:methyltransferase domain-containing protein [Solirubrobacteraceae bacterium]